MNKPVLSCHQLTKTFQDGKREINVLNNIDFSVQPGESVAILGSSGSGKSTLLHLLGGLDKPTEGTVSWLGDDLATLSETERCKRRNQHLGFVYQFHHLLPEFNALENTAMPLLIAKNITVEAAKTQAYQILEKVGLKQRVSHKIAQLSGGERQRVALARALVTAPRVVLADEPTGNLDSKTARSALDLMFKLQHDLNLSLVIVTHDLSIAARLNTCLVLDQAQLKKAKT
jgi:lipoprotein-releasing system ATP-binding protein